MASELTRKTATELAAAVSGGEVSAAEVTQAHLDRIAEVDGRLKAFLHVSADDALAQARAVDNKCARGEEGPVRHRRDADDLRVEDPARLGPPV
jgi:aspartyl-tRNA(Asn)/glutamyl-tRNA(Gln) amidotransferase subunit A